MQPKGATIIDNQTGQILGIPYFAGKKSAFSAMYGKGGWLAVAQEALLRIVQDKDITQEPMRVFVYLCARLEFENFIRVSQKEIGEALKMDKSKVSKSIKLLESKGILLRGPKVGLSYTYRLNPKYGYKGDAAKIIHADFRAKRELEAEAYNQVLPPENPQPYA